MSAKVQRLRVRYERGAEVQYVSHLDMLRFWERALRRAHLAVAYSEGFTPHPQINLGVPLSVGMTGAGELLDVFLAEPVASEEFRSRLQAQLPPGMTIRDVVELPVTGPSLQAQVRAARYGLRLVAGADIAVVEQRLNDLLAAETFPWEHRREKDVKRYDLRPLILDARVEDRDGSAAIVATLRTEEGLTGRPDQLAA